MKCEHTGREIKSPLDMTREEIDGPDLFGIRRPLLRVDRPWSEYPLGTKAHAHMGGCWTRVEHGWKWGSLNGGGGVFPTPGGDACGPCIELPNK